MQFRTNKTRQERHWKDGICFREQNDDSDRGTETRFHDGRARVDEERKNLPQFMSKRGKYLFLPLPMTLDSKIASKNINQRCAVFSINLNTFLTLIEASSPEACNKNITSTSHRKMYDR